MTNRPDTPQSRPRPVVLCVLDGWGHRVECDDNAICQARTPAWTAMTKNCPHALVRAAASDVGLPAGQMGNSEVGHMNLGAGRVVMQDLPRIDGAIRDGSLAANPALERFTGKLKASGGTCHLIGLISPGGVHSHQDQIAALACLVAAAGVPVAVHALLDGRDTPPKSALGYLDAFSTSIADAPGARIATVTGRYWAMDRDKRWERISRAYEVIVDATGEHAETALDAVTAAYEREETDEFVAPTAIAGYAGAADGDGILMANFRADRAREILTALISDDFDGFERRRCADFAARLGLTEYSTALNAYLDCLFPAISLDHILGQVLAEAGFKQLRIAETEKYAHVTFFFNGGVEDPFPGEDRILIPSPKVATYDLKPEMSAPEVTDKLVAAIEGGAYDFILVNYANTDMVGHTGNLDAAVKAVEAVDHCLGRLRDAVEAAGGVLLITADHGNAELMRDYEFNQPHTAHTVNTVPLILVNAPARVSGIGDGRLSDVAPTVLALMGLAKPHAMTGDSLVVAAEESHAGAGAAQ